MRWVKSSVFPIAVVSAVIGGYYLTANDRIEEFRDVELDEQIETPVSSEIHRVRSEPEKRRIAEVEPRSMLVDEPTSVHAELALLRKELTELKSTQAHLRQALDDLVNQGHHLDNGSTNSESMDLETETTAQSKTLDLERNFESETVDPSWGNAAEVEIQSTLAERIPDGVYVANAECRHTICRIDVEFDDAKSKLEGLQFLPMLIPWAGESITQIDPNGDRNAVLYAAREGYSLFGDSTGMQW